MPQIGQSGQSRCCLGCCAVCKEILLAAGPCFFKICVLAEDDVVYLLICMVLKHPWRMCHRPGNTASFT